jgi:agmatine/peptidylarginine deiminase
MTRRFRLPAEWHRQSCAMLTWPHESTDWRENLEAVEKVYLEIAREITRRQRLLVVCLDAYHRVRTEEMLIRSAVTRDNLLFAVAPSNDSWSRDHGPLTCVADGKARLKDFRFDGWGGRFAAGLDDRISRELAESGVFGQFAMQRIEMTLEGGAVETDGAGTLLATRASIVDERRNPGISLGAAEKVLQTELGLERFLWLNHGRVSGDDTDGHIDILARFTDPTTIVHTTALPEDEDFTELERMAVELRRFRRADGSPYRLRPLPPIPPILDDAGRRLPASYANFLIINGAVLLPVYAVAADAAAVSLLADCFPERAIIPIDCRPLISQNGSLHCITMQFPEELDLQPSC